MILISLMFLVLGYYGYQCHKLTTEINDSTLHKVDSIETYIDTVYVKIDSLLTNVKESKDVVNYVENEYKNNYIHIVNESITDDMCFFAEYLSKNDERFINNNYSNTTKEN